MALLQALLQHWGLGLQFGTRRCNLRPASGADNATAHHSPAGPERSHGIISQGGAAVSPCYTRCVVTASPVGEH